METLKNRAEAYIKSHMEEDFISEFATCVANSETLVERAQARYAEKPTIRRRQRVHRTQRALENVIHDFWDAAYQERGVQIRKEYDAEQQAAAWSRGADYQTEMRMRSRIYQIYGSLD